MSERAPKFTSMSPSGRLEWLDAQGDSFLIEPETTVADPDVVAGIAVADSSDGQEAAVWVRRHEARALGRWLLSLAEDGGDDA